MDGIVRCQEIRRYDAIVWFIKFVSLTVILPYHPSYSEMRSEPV